MLDQRSTTTRRSACGRRGLSANGHSWLCSVVTVERFYVGGLFIRMPWHKGIAGEVINAAGQP